jgi:5-methylcytosine-specific restriction endonuclease McrA
MTQRTCAIEGCGRPHCAKGFCKNHHAQWNYAQNVAARRAQQAIYRSTRREKARATSRAWQRANPERVKEANRAWYAANKDRVREYKRAYRERKRDQIRALNNARKALKRGVEINDLTAAQWTEIKAAYGQRCAYCRTKTDLTMDHVTPLSKGGHHTASNIVPACQPCNSRKGDREAPTFQPLLM